MKITQAKPQHIVKVRISIVGSIQFISAKDLNFIQLD
jgi:hypothetical protein